MKKEFLNHYSLDFKGSRKKQENGLKMCLVKDDEMALSEHVEEFSQRIVFCLILLVLASLLCFIDIREITYEIKVTLHQF